MIPLRPLVTTEASSIRGSRASWIRPIGLAVVLVLAACDSTGGQPPSMIALAAYAPPMPSGVVATCEHTRLGGTLRGDPADPSVAWLVSTSSGKRIDVLWPDGYHARFTPDLEVLDEAGNVVLHAGDLVSEGCITAIPGTYLLQPPSSS